MPRSRTGAHAQSQQSEMLALTYSPHVRNRIIGTTFHQQSCSSLVSVMIELNNLIARQEMRCEQLIIHVRQNSDAAEAEVERMYLLALLEDLAS